ncbi:MAG: CHAT domain-containing protein [Nostocales cyanobacterium 94392]|nr:CHAT domain-containing protein [Nostocales cyanobacterium 94392]
MYLSPKINLLLLIGAIAQILALGIGFTPAQAQSIKPAADGTNTQVTTNGNQIDINGGTRSNANLFHSFEKFGLNQNEIANFLATPDIQNILGRVVGGNPSVINGLIQVTGGNPNLFLMNPNGIFFGPNAILNVPADFTATTATNISIGENWFNAFGANNYADLTESPNGFVFSNLQPGSIVNAGNLVVSSGSNLRLFGGTVASTGDLSGGNVTVATVPGENFLRITPQGHLLSLEVPASVTSTNTSVASLPQLLTGSGFANATGLTVNNGKVELTSSGNSVNSGDVVANKVTAENATLSAEKNLTLIESQLQTTGDLNLLAKDTVFVRDSLANPFVAIARGNLYVQGNQNIDILALNHPQIPFQSGGNLSLVSDGNVSGDAHFSSGGQFKISNLSGEPGNFVSIFDPIIRANGDVEFANYSGAALKVEATGSIKGGDITITSPDTSDSIPSSDPDFTALTTTNALILRAGLDSVTNPDNLPVSVEGTPFETPNSALQPLGSIQVGNIRTGTLLPNQDGGSVNLQATGNIVTGNIISGAYVSNERAGRGGAVSITSSNGSITTGNINANSYSNGNTNTFSRKAGNAGTITLSAANNISTGYIDTTSIFQGFIDGFSLDFDNVTTGDGGKISITTTNGDINTGVLFSGAYAEEGNAGNGGDISLSANNGSITTGAIVSATVSAEYGDVGSGGDINISAKGNINTKATGLSSFTGQNYFSNIENIANLSDYDNLTTGIVASAAYAAEGNTGNAGTINITSTEGTITTGFIASIVGAGDLDDINNVGAITLNAQSDIITDLILLLSGNGGTINITSTNGSITTGALLSVAASGEDGVANGGDITINAKNGSITTGPLLSAITSVDNEEQDVNSTKGGNITLNAKNDVTVGAIGLSKYLEEFDASYQDLDIFAALDDIALELGFNEGEVDVRTVLDNIDNITSGFIISATGVDSGDISSGGAINITSTEGSIKTGFTASIAGTGNGNAGNGGNITMTANNNITTGIIFSGTGTGNGNAGNGGNISLKASNGSITTSPLISTTLSLDGSTGDAGAITLEAKNDVKVDTIGFSTLAEGIDLDNDITDSLAALDNLTKGWIISTTVARNGNAGNGSAINITSTEGSITTGPITSVVYVNDGSAGKAGDINLSAKNDISADLLASVSYGSEDDDEVISGEGGNITVTTDSFFRAPQTLGNLLSEFLDQQQVINDEDLKSELKDSLEDFENYSIGSYGRAGSGSITIQHGGNGNVPFVVGDATKNGTAGDIITGGFLDGLYTEISSTQTFPGNFTKGKIEIITQNQDEIPEEIKRLAETTPNQQLPTNSIPQLEVNTLVEEIEQQFTQQFLEFGGDDNVEIKTVQDTQGLLSNIGKTTGVKPAVIYTTFLPETYVAGSSLVRQEKDTDVLNIIIVTAEGQPIRKQIKGATRREVSRVARRFSREVANQRKANSTEYLAPAKQLYEWLVKPYEAEILSLDVKNLMYIMDPGLRHLPIAALHDGNQFIIEKYSIGLLPSISLTDTRYVGVQNSKVLAMGSPKFTQDQDQRDLPAVPIELSTIAGELWEGKYVSGENFTLDNLKSERTNTPYGIIHLATHADFPSEGDGGRKESYIQLYNSKLRLEDVRKLGWNNPPVELLVLSACRSALGDFEAELGYAGLAIQTGVKSAVASLWFVSDAGTLGVMTEFYRQLNKAPIKAEALRQTQLAMLQGKVRIEGNQLIGTNGNVTLSPEQAEYLRNNITGELSHPYYWASFTMIGSPW